MRFLLDLKGVLRRLWPRPDPLRALLKERLRQLRKRAAREPDEVEMREVVALWRALRAEEMSRRVPASVILGIAAVLVLLVAILALWRVDDADVELTGVASGFTFEIDPGRTVALLPSLLPLVSLRAAGSERLVIDGHREIESSYLTVGPKGGAQLVSALSASPGKSVLLHQPAPGVIAVSLELDEPLAVSVAEPGAVRAEDDLADLGNHSILEIVPTADEPLDLEIEIDLGEIRGTGRFRESMLAQRIPIESLRFQATLVNHENPELTRTVGTLHRASLGFLSLPYTSSAIGQGAWLQLEKGQGELEYWLNEAGYLGFRYEGPVGELYVKPRRAEKPRPLFPTLLEILRNKRGIGLVASSIFLVIAAMTTLLQMRRLL